MLIRRPDMKSRFIPGIFLYAVCIQLSAVAATNNGLFKSYLTIATLPVGVRNTLEVAQSTDVEIAVRDAQDRVVRNLVAGEPWRAAEQPGWPTFVGNDVYFSGSEQLRRIRNIVPAQ